MLIPDHPDPERLSALASHDDDAMADAALASHVSTCDRCTSLIDELGALRASLAELPDIAPSRPLQLLPPVADAREAVGAAGWVRRLFAPVLTAGAALAMVGLVGTTAPLLGGMASSGAAPQEEADMDGAEEPGTSLSQVLSTDAAAPAAGAGGEAAAESPPEQGEDSLAEGGPYLSSQRQTFSQGQTTAQDRESGDSGDDDALTTLPAERSPWPMVLFTGLTLVIAALLLRWILVPRAG